MHVVDIYQCPFLPKAELNTKTNPNGPPSGTCRVHFGVPLRSMKRSAAWTGPCCIGSYWECGEALSKFLRALSVDPKREDAVWLTSNLSNSNFSGHLYQCGMDRSTPHLFFKWTELNTKTNPTGPGRGGVGAFGFVLVFNSAFGRRSTDYHLHHDWSQWSTAYSELRALCAWLTSEIRALCAALTSVLGVDIN